MAQATPKDRRASVTSRSYTDGFFSKVLSLLDIPIEPVVMKVKIVVGTCASIPDSD